MPAPGLADNRKSVVIATVVLFFVSLILASYSSRNAWVSEIGSVFVAESIRPFQAVVRGVGGTAVDYWGDYLALWDVHAENERLRARLELLESENSRLLEWESEITRLRGLLNIAQEEGLKGIAADVIGYDPSNWVQAITINRGSSDGLRSGLAVIKGNYVVGQVVAVSPRSARVLLITDHSSGVDSIVQSSRARGVVRGLGGEQCELNHVLIDEEVAVGDRIITSGMDGVFPKGLLVGIVLQIDKRGKGMFQNIRIRPSVKFSRLETVLVVTSFESPSPSGDGSDPASSGGKAAK